MPKSITEILSENAGMTDEVKTALTEAFEARVAEQREEVAAELREEFAGRHDQFKSQVTEAMDAMMKDALKAELDEFAQDQAKLAEDRVKAKAAIKEHAKMVNDFIKEALTAELRELKEDRKAQQVNMGKLEEFVLHQLTNELNEFHEDKRSLAEQRVKMVANGEKMIAEARDKFIKQASAATEKMVESVMKSELTALKEDIQTAKENEFGRKIFESFANEYLASTLNESTQTAKLNKKIMGLEAQLTESEVKIASKDKALMEANRAIRVAKDTGTRKAIMSEMLKPLNKNQRQLMSSLLESVKTDKLEASYNKYLPNVLAEGEEAPKAKATLTESKTEVNGNKSKIQTEAGGQAEVIRLARKLSGQS